MVSLLEIVIPVEATGLFSYAWLMIAIPLVVSAILLLGRRGEPAEARDATPQA